MNSLLTIRSKIKDFFSKYDVFVVPALKFILAFFVFLQINLHFSYFELLNNVFILIIVSLICALLPVNAIFIAASLMLVLHCFALNVFVGAFAAGLILLLLIMLLRFSAKESLAVVLTPFAFGLNIAPAIPLGLGALRNYRSILAGICSVAVYCFVDQLPSIELLTKQEDLSSMELLKTMVVNYINHDELILSCVVFSAVILIVRLIRKTITKHIYLISCSVGAVLYLVLREAGAYFINVKTNVLMDILGTVISLAIVLVISFFIYCVDYTHTKRLQFEDEEYYYFVKAVPKRKPENYVEYNEDEEEEYPDDK